MAILSSADYPSIRAAIGSDIDADQVPDATIALPIYAGRAEAMVLARDPLAESRTGAELQRIKNAAVLFAAALLAPSLRQAVSVSAGGTSVNWGDGSKRIGELVAALTAAAEAELAAVLNPGQPDDDARPLGFGLASSGRSWRPAAV